ncbi:hypothetical protein OY671_010664, partial [Metschnikowia pulcherrima]
PPGSLRSSSDIGTGPNVYPLMSVAAASRRLEASETSASNVAYLRRTCREGADPCWTPFWQLCRQLDPASPADLDGVSRGSTIHHGDASRVPSGQHDRVSMFFVAESVTGDRDEFEQRSRRFAAAAAPGGHSVAAYMAGMPQYESGGEISPSFPLDRHTSETVMRPVTRQSRI